MNQLLLGMLPAFLVGFIVYVSRRGRATTNLLLLTPLWMALGAFWATAPDLPRLLRNGELYQALAQDPRADYFFWHFRIDLAETASPVYSTLVVLLFIGLLVAAWRELLHRETAR